MDLLILGLLVLVGLVAGAMSGLFGVGGGIIVVPALVLIGSLSFRDAVAASLLFITLTSPVAIWRHWAAGNVQPKTGLLLGATGLLGVLVASLVGPRLTDAALILGFCALLVAAAHNLAYGRPPERHHGSPAIIVAVGVFGGFVAKLFGIGGGIVMVPSLVFTGIDIHLAIGTSLVSVWTNAVVSTGLNLSRGHAWAVWALPTAVGAFAGSFLGAAHSVRTHGPALRRWFALLMVFVALDLARQAF